MNGALGTTVTGSDAREGLALDAETLCEAFEITSAALADQVAIRTRGDELTLTWSQWRERARDLAGGLHKLGLRRGQTLAIMLSNRPEFHVVDLASVTLGATPFSIYQTFAPSHIEFVISDSGARIAVVQSEHLDERASGTARDPRPGARNPDRPARWQHAARGRAHASAGRGVWAHEECRDAIEQAAAQVTPDDILTLIYTSGTTGPPKGVQLSHRNLLSVVAAIGPIRPGSRVISWLPAAHIAERDAHHYMPIVYGLQITCCPDPRELASYLPEVRPQRFFAVPRIWEKLKAGLEARIVARPAEQRERSERALGAAMREGAPGAARGGGPRRAGREVAAADEREMFAGLREALGLDRVEAVHVGAAPTPVEVIEFFHAIGVPLAELWGMSESAAGWRPSTRRRQSRSAPSARRLRASRSPWRMTARCSCAARP